MTFNILVGITNIFVAIVTIAVSIPLIRDKIPMNGFYGVRFPKSYESEENWYRINRFGGRNMIQWGTIIGFLGAGALFLHPTHWALYPLLFAAPVAMTIACVQMYLYSRKL